MANDINLISGSGINFDLNTTDNKLTISVAKNTLDTLEDATSDIITLTNEITALKNEINALKTSKTDDWVKDLIDKYAVNQTNGLIDYGTADPEKSGGANSRAKIYVKY